MAKVINNELLTGLSGRVGNILVKNYKDGTIISKLPSKTRKKATKKQKSERSHFSLAIAHAIAIKSDPNLASKAAKRNNTGLSLYLFLVKEYLDSVNRRRA